MASLIITSGPGQGNYYPLGQRTSVVGRDEGVLIQLLEEHVSRKHMRIRYEREKDRYLAEDMQSRHGTFVNGQRIHSEVELRDNDSLDVGGVTLLFTVEDFADRESALKHWHRIGERMRGTLIE